jgi:3-phenylpropionate/trans-cinnamate dioxygenase ferredoxin subunit
MLNYRTLPEARLTYISVARVEELLPGERAIFEIGDLSIAVFQIAGRYFAISDLCSHDDGPVAEGDVAGEEIACPRHGARFSLESGKALSLPAVSDIPAYPVRVLDGEIQVGLPTEAP